ncbi:hypothetical protein NC651_032837 [Populus alba x Populus x berolinensis]|nr:hypothetical protein NC651_032837 [Populus alba x Populus x berolinensis]
MLCMQQNSLFSVQTEIGSEIHVTASELCISVINNQPSTSHPICQHLVALEQSKKGMQQNDQPAIQFSTRFKTEPQKLLIKILIFNNYHH